MGKSIPLKLTSDSSQPLLNCYGSFHLTVNDVPLLGEEMVAEQQQKNKIKLHTTVLNGAKSDSPSAG